MTASRFLNGMAVAISAIVIPASVLTSMLVAATGLLFGHYLFASGVAVSIWVLIIMLPAANILTLARLPRHRPSPLHLTLLGGSVLLAQWGLFEVLRLMLNPPATGL